MKPFKISGVEFAKFWSDDIYWETYYVDDCEIHAGKTVIFHSENEIDLTVDINGDTFISDELKRKNITFISGDVYGRETDEMYTIEEFYETWRHCMDQDVEPVVEPVVNVKLTITLPSDKAEEVMDTISKILELADIQHGMDLEG